MTTIRTIIAVVVLLAILGVVYLVQKNNDDETETAETVLSVSALNQTKNADATTTPANPNDIIAYTVTVENPTDEVVEGYITEVNIADISELATLIDAQGANYNSATNSLIWTPLDVPANGKIEKQFSVRVKNELPANSDLVMSTQFNNQLNVSIAKEQVAGAATDNETDTATGRPVAYTSPTTGPSVSVIIMLAAGLTAVLWLVRRKLGITA